MNYFKYTYWLVYYTPEHFFVIAWWIAIQLMKICCNHRWKYLSIDLKHVTPWSIDYKTDSAVRNSFYIAGTYLSITKTFLLFTKSFVPFINLIFLSPGPYWLFNYEKLSFGHIHLLRLKQYVFVFYVNLLHIFHFYNVVFHQKLNFKNLHLYYRYYCQLSFV